MSRAALILAGGAGTRLWPLSSDDRPKQFLPLFEGRSLLQRTYERLVRLVDPAAIFISTNERYAGQCREQLPEIPEVNILTEPARRNTGPAIALCCFEIEQRLGETTIAVLPSDHFIGDVDTFLQVLDRAYWFAEASDHLVTIGIDPTEPNTGFGYLQLAEELTPGLIRLERVVEKPDRERAEEFLRAGNYVWNGGMFVWRASVFRRELERAAPELARVTRESYEAMPSISIDFALMEKARNVATVRGEFRWSDVGSWAAIARVAPGAATAELVTRNAENVFALAAKRVTVIGISNIAVVDSPEGLLVLDLASSELLSDVVKRFSQR